jgi:short-subunit dehydrogenase
VPISEAKYQFEVNIFGLARLTQLALPYMRAQRSGKVINISSIGGKIGEPHGAWYHATKFAVEGLSDSLRMELRQFGIDVVIIEPGVDQDRMDRHSSPEYAQNIRSNSLRRTRAETRQTI